MKDLAWQQLRYLLIALGMFFAGKGYVTMEQIMLLADELPRIAGAAMSFAAMAWGLYVKFNTRAVPIATANRPDIPTVSPVTGAVER